MRLKYTLLLVGLLAVQFPIIARGESRGNLAAAPTDTFSFASLGYQQVPLEPNNTNTSWLVPVSLNGKPCKLLLDTGADFIILESWVPERFGFATQPTDIQANHVGGARKLVVAEVPLSIGGKTLEKQHVRAMADGDTAPNASAQAPIAGVLGHNALRSLGAVLDIRRHTLWLPKKADASIATAMERVRAAKIPVRQTAKTKHLFVEGRTGKEPLRMILDTGAELTVLSSASAEALKLPLTDARIRFAGASEGNSKTKQGVLADVTFGQAVINRLPVVVIPLESVFKMISEGEPQLLDGILGADVLEKAGGIFDIAANALYLTGNAPAGSNTKAKAKTKAPAMVAGHIVVPLERTDGMQFLLTGKIKDRDVRFAVDSGADSIVVHQPLAAELGISLNKSKDTARGAGGNAIDVSYGKLPGIELPGGLIIQKPSVAFLDLGDFTEISIGRKPAKLDALLGHDFLRSTGMVVDLSNNRMLVPGDDAKRGDYAAYIMRFGGQPVKLLRGANGGFYMPMQLDGEKVALMIDTGANTSTLNADYVAGKKWKRERSGGADVKTLGQKQQQEIATVPTVSFGPTTVPNVPFVVVNHSESAGNQKVDGRKVVGLLGVNALIPLQTILDFGTAQAFFPPSEASGK